MKYYGKECHFLLTEGSTGHAVYTRAKFAFQCPDELGQALAPSSSGLVLLLIGARFYFYPKRTCIFTLLVPLRETDLASLPHTLIFL